MFDKGKTTNAYDKSEFHMKLFSATTNVVPSTLISKSSRLIDSPWFELLTVSQTADGVPIGVMTSQPFFQSEYFNAYSIGQTITTKGMLGDKFWISKPNIYQLSPPKYNGILNIIVNRRSFSQKCACYYDLYRLIT